MRGEVSVSDTQAAALNLLARCENRFRFETAQVMKKIEKQKDIPAGRWTVFVEKT